MTSSPSAHPPQWVKDAVFYQIFPDRFARSEMIDKPNNLEPWDSPPTVHGFKGGDLRGVQERLDYLQELGITAIYFNPIFQSAANHRYHTHDYHQVDPILGGNEAFRDLLDAAHERGIRIVLDGVFNHASRGFYQFHHALENGAASPYLDWFYFDEKRLAESGRLNAYPSPDEEQGQHQGQSGLEKYGYRAWADLPALPKLNTDNPQVREFLMGAAEYWLQQGIDGWRLDVPLEIRTPGFWEEFRQRVKAINPEAYIVAEIWEEAAAWLEGGPFDAVMNYVFTRACLGFFGGEALDTSARPGGYPLQQLSGEAFADKIDRLLKTYSWENTLAQLNLLDSHDMPRFLTLISGESPRLKLAVLFQMTFPGAPCVYYGDEIGMEGGPDPDCRRAFSWDESRWDRDLRDWFRRCIELRHAHPALRQGEFHRLYADRTVYAFARTLKGETLLIVLNADAAERSVEIPMQGLVPDGTPLRDPLSERTLTVNDGVVRFSLSPFGGMVLRAAS